MVRALLCIVFTALVGSSFANGLEAVAQTTLSHITETRLKKQIDWRDYHVSDSISSSHKKWLKKRILSFRKNHLSSQFQFEVHQVKSDGDLAILVLDIEDPQDPYFYQAVSFALCKTDAGWRVAPLAGSFRFSGIKNYLPEVAKRREILELWASELVAKRTIDVRSEKQRFVKKSMAEHRRESSALSRESSESAALYFLEQCRNRDIYGMLACLSDSDFKARQTLIEVMRGSGDLGQWEVLLGKNYFHTTLPKVGKLSTMVSVGIFAPEAETHNRIVEFDLKREGTRWTVHLPAYLLLNPKNDTHVPRLLDFQKYQLKSENRKRLETVDELIISQMRSGDFNTASKVVQEATRCITERDVTAFFRLIEWNGLAEQNAGSNPRDTFYASLNYWNGLMRDGYRFSLDRIDDFGAENGALFCCLTYSQARPNDYALKPFYLRKSKKGSWFVQPVLDSGESIASELELQKVMPLGLESYVFAKILPEVTSLAGAELSEVVELSAVEQCYADYVDAVKAYQWEAVSKFLALEPAGEGNLLKVLGYEARYYHSLVSEVEFVEVLSAGRSTGVIVRQNYKDDAASTYRLYPCVQLDSTIKIIPQSVYFYAHTRGERLMNSQISETIKHSFDVAFHESRAKLIDQFNQRVEQLELETNE